MGGVSKCSYYTLQSRPWSNHGLLQLACILHQLKCLRYKESCYLVLVAHSFLVYSIFII